MKICLDCDGVIADIHTEFQYRLKETFGLELPQDEWKTHRIAEQFPEVPEEWVDAQLADPSFFLNAKPYEDAWYMVNKWFMAGNDVFIVTCRGAKTGPRTKEITDRWFDEWEINYNKIYYDQVRFSKHTTCEALGADIFVEDDPREVEINSAFCSSYLVDHGYNGHYEMSAGTRIKSLKELDGLISNETNKMPSV